MVRIQGEALADAVAAGQLGPAADSDEAVFLVSILITGALTQAMANEPGLPWGEGRFTPLFPRLMGHLADIYPPGATAPPMTRRTHTPQAGGRGRWRRSPLRRWSIRAR